MNLLILLGTWAIGWWLIRRDNQRRPDISNATWIPTLWLGVLASRPLSMWIGMGGGEDTLEGSPLDRLFYLSMIVCALVVLSRRNIDWPILIARHWPLLLFYGYLLLSVTWANSPVVSLKRWTKECGNIFVALVILSEANPIQALRAVFVRCAYILIPLSVVYIRYFPGLGRHYNIHSGLMEATGVSTQKNSLGAMILVCMLMFIWDLIERTRPQMPRLPRTDRWTAYVLLAMAAWLAHISDSKTSMVCLAVGTVIIAATRVPMLHRRVSALGAYILVGLVGYLVLDQAFGISATIVASLGRDMTFTGRTDVWRALLAVHTDPLFGTGFMSFWDDPDYRAQLPRWVAFSAHNGYLELYLAGGAIALACLSILLLTYGIRLNRALAQDGDFALVRFAIYVVMLIANFSESNFACMTPLGFAFLLAIIGDAPKVAPQALTHRGWSRTLQRETPVGPMRQVQVAPGP